MSIKSSLENLFDDLTSLEVAAMKSDGNSRVKSALTYTQTQLEGDTINWLKSGNYEHKNEIIELHEDMVKTSQQGRLSLIRFAGTVLNNII